MSTEGKSKRSLVGWMAALIGLGAAGVAFLANLGGAQTYVCNITSLCEPSRTSVLDARETAFSLFFGERRPSPPPGLILEQDIFRVRLALRESETSIVRVESLTDRYTIVAPLHLDSECTNRIANNTLLLRQTMAAYFTTAPRLLFTELFPDHFNSEDAVEFAERWRLQSEEQVVVPANIEQFKENLQIYASLSQSDAPSTPSFNYSTIAFVVSPEGEVVAAFNASTLNGGPAMPDIPEIARTLLYHALDHHPYLLRRDLLTPARHTIEPREAIRVWDVQTTDTPLALDEQFLRVQRSLQDRIAETGIEDECQTNPAP